MTLFGRKLTKRLVNIMTVIWLIGMTLILSAATDLFTQSPFESKNISLFLFTVIPSFIVIIGANLFVYVGLKFLKK